MNMSIKFPTLHAPMCEVKKKTKKKMNFFMNRAWIGYNSR